MKNYIHKITILLLVLINISCESHLINGDLDGFWQVRTVEHLKKGETIYHNNEAFYAFQRHIVQLTLQTETHVMGQMGPRYHAEFNWQDDSIKFGEFREYDLYGCKKRVGLDTLKIFGIFHENETFHVENLNRTSLILTSEETRIKLRKY